jgi:predicted dehydrogenase
MPRIAVLSTAHIHTGGFLKSLKEMTSAGGAHVIWDDVPERGQEFAKEYGCPFEPDIDAVLADAEIEGFLICAENTRHLSLLQHAIPLGKPIMCEKPLATTVADAQAIAALLREHGTTLLSGYFIPFDAGHQGAKNFLEAGGLGKVTHCNFRNAHHAAYGRWFDSPALAWFADPDLSGGGALMDMGTHGVHLLRRLFGPVERAWSVQGNYSGNYPDVDDYGVIEMEFASGVLGRVEASWVFTGGAKGLEVIGSEKSLWNGPDGLVSAAPGEDTQPVPAGDAKPSRIARLIAAIRGELSEDELADDLAACLDAVAIMAAAYESGKSGKWEPVAKL